MELVIFRTEMNLMLLWQFLTHMFQNDEGLNLEISSCTKDFHQEKSGWIFGSIWIFACLPSGGLKNHVTKKHQSSIFRKIRQNSDFIWLVFPHIRTESKMLSLYRRIRARENPYSRIGKFISILSWIKFSAHSRN